MSTVSSKVQQGATIVAIDLGSNSFHMIVTELQRQLVVVDRLRERVQLAAGVDGDKRLSPDAMLRGLDCLARFGERLRTVPDALVRAVGTNTLRVASNAPEFIERAHEVLGHRVEVIGGREEARLIYLGVAHDLADDAGRRLVVDIGGGSTECILGERFEPLRTESLHMGCVTYTQRHFGDGRLTRQAFRDAVTAARVELEPIKVDYKRMGWMTAVGASGTIKAIDQVLRTNGWSDEGITLAGMRALRNELCAQGRVAGLAVPDLSSERAPVIAGGLAILIAVFKSLRVDRMTASGGALREGVVYDTIGRINHEDVRDQTSERLLDLHRADREQASRVESTALELFDQVAQAWQLDDPTQKMLLGWAARLHELGRVVTFSAFHMHGAYLLEHTDMPGFSRDQQTYLAALVGAHRRRLKADRLAALQRAGGIVGLRLAALLRLSATLHRSRAAEPLPKHTLVADGGKLTLTLPEGWLDDRPMTRADLASQTAYLSAAGLQFTAE